MANPSAERWGYLDTSGNVAIPFQFEWCSQFRERRAVIAVGEKRGFIDHSGTIVIEPRFGPETNAFFEGLALAQLSNGKCGYIDRDGAFAIEPRFDWGGCFSEGLAFVRVRGKYGFINKDGEYVVKPQFDHVEDFSCGYASVSFDGKKGRDGETFFIDKLGQRVRHLAGAGSFSEGIAVDYEDGVYSLLRTDGSTVPLPGANYVSQYFCCGRIEFYRFLDGGNLEKHGYFDRDGNIALEPVFDDASTFVEGFANVRQGDFWGFIDVQGKWAIAPRFEKADFFKEGLAHVKIDGKDCFIDQSGRVVFRTEYHASSPFSEGLTPAYIDK
jgi:hypothetical protein